MKLKDKKGKIKKKDYAFVCLMSKGKPDIKFYVEIEHFSELNRVLKYCDWYSEEV